jgi:hypothetical protein
VFDRSQRTLTVEAPRRIPGTTGSRIESLVDGVPVWFESSEIELQPAPEAFPSAFLIPGLHRRARLSAEAPVDSRWRDNLDPLVEILHAWWRTPRLPPEVATRPALNGDVPSASRTALFFSGGVDSFYSLLEGGRRVDLLVLIHGFDYPLSDGRRHAAAERTLRAVAAAAGADWAVLRTNVREHPWLQGVSWERTHGGILAAAAHLLPENVSEVWISSSISIGRGQPWGSHWRIDPLWSSARRRVVPVGQELRRSEKLSRIAAEPLSQAHLRVCWENAAGSSKAAACWRTSGSWPAPRPCSPTWTRSRAVATGCGRSTTCRAIRHSTPS